MVGVILRADCNAGTNIRIEKGWYQDPFHLWLVHNSIANLLSLPQLEDDGFTISYHSRGKWIVTTPQGKDITFNRKPDGVHRGFPYLNMRSTLAMAMIQTIRQRYKRLHKM
jgi:hypothetical protein